MEDDDYIADAHLQYNSIRNRKGAKFNSIPLKEHSTAVTLANSNSVIGARPNSRKQQPTISQQSVPS